MSVQREIPGKAILEAIADDSGVAVVVVDRSGIEISAFNNNSICKLLNPDGEIVEECSAYCGLALAEATEVGGHASFTCHAGLECRATALMLDGKPVAAIAGRSFGRSEDYRRATERAMDGDWQKFAPSDLFENVLLTGSADILEKTIKRIEAEALVLETDDDEPANTPVDDIIAARAETATEQAAAETARAAERINREAVQDEKDATDAASPNVDVVAMRAFLSTILSQDYSSACESFLGLIAENYGFSSLAWLERRDSRLTTVAGYGPLKKRRLNLGMPPDDIRLVEAAKTESPVELTEKAARTDEARTMYLFPVPVGDDIPSALAVLDPIEKEVVKQQIARLCQTIGPQIEILRLRGEVLRRDSLSQAVRKFSDGLKHVDAEDFWLRMTQVASELLQAERGSLLVMNETSGMLEIKAAVGSRTDISHDPMPGSRVARKIFERGKAAVVADVGKTGLPPIPTDRGYKTSSFLSSPISLGGRNIAVISFTDKASGAAFGRSDLDLLDEISPQIAVAIDRAMLKEKAGEFEQLSVTDALTGLLNRRYIEERLIEEVKRSNRHGYPMSFVMLDVDHFKSYNDQFGHPAGDEALKIVGQVLRDTLRGADVAARYGGEEFAILLPQTTSDEAAVIAERLRVNVESAEFPCRDVTVSIGVASGSAELCTTDGLIKAADRALYDAKRNGRNLVRIYAEHETEAMGV